ncbi:MAG: glutamate 5-kinase [Ignavibacteriales bacterium]|nr:glutamate 5-kinase [Ignavibacteriales bacterium]
MVKQKSYLQSSRKIVIKIGTNLLADKMTGVNTERLESIARSVAQLQSRGKQVALVSSGAIGAGVAALQLKTRPRTLAKKQAAAAIGQPLLMEAYEHAFRKHRCMIGQILLTKEDFIDRRRFVNARNTFAALFEQGVVPIVNENDTVAVEEIKLGDNDNLSAFVVNLIGADLLILLSDIDGLYSDDPARHSKATLIPVVEKITPQIERLARSSNPELSTGGMITKIQAAKRCVSSGAAMIIANGNNPEIIDDIVSGTYVGTIFLPDGRGLNRKKKWIGFVSHAEGVIVVDDGAKNALVVKKKSLLASGIMTVRGEFDKGDTVLVCDAAGNNIAKGVVRYSHGDLARIKGKKSHEAAKILGCKTCEEVIRRDDLAVIE